MESHEMAGAELAAVEATRRRAATRTTPSPWFSAASSTLVAAYVLTILIPDGLPKFASTAVLGGLTVALAFGQARRTGVRRYSWSKRQAAALAAGIATLLGILCFAVWLHVAHPLTWATVACATAAWATTFTWHRWIYRLRNDVVLAT